MNNLVEHARRELARFETDPWAVEGIVKVVQAFADMGHSGGSASVCIPIINSLLQHKNLTPLTDDPAEWLYHEKEMWDGKTGIWQNIRNSEAFSIDGGKTYTLVSDADDDVQKPLYTSVPAVQHG